MSVHKRLNGTYFVSFRDSGGRQRTKNTGSGEEGKRAAEALDHEIKAKKLRGEEVEQQSRRGMYFDELCQLCIDTKKSEGKGGNGWLKDWANNLNNHILPGLPMVPVNELTMQDILSFMMRKYAGHAPSTRNRYLSYLKVILNFGVEHGLIDHNPLKRWKKAKEKPRQSTLTVEQLKAIIEHAAPHLRWALEVAFYLGVRTGESELLSLRWDQVNWENKEIEVYATKTNTFRKIPLSPAFFEKLKARFPEANTEFLVEYQGRQIKSIKGAFRTARKKAGVGKSVITYDIRHLFATTLLNKGGDLASVSNLMGHASTKMTADQYYHVLKEEKVRTVNLLPEL
ncbi:tyrosine-type recombinase/integrase [uncultured Pseudodesulfovibrio sp.]|uniref:tyrosine-type recombinase/integrase n=1 Tax=uncultured Pseudodesulfovibrio sp. TaxID=2035858 RepID=UPI0029C6F4B4|nr:tyrosine-type recombinase/integrase [uncultured Pseudodesulfovibrio sp.]